MFIWWKAKRTKGSHFAAGALKRRESVVRRLRTRDLELLCCAKSLQGEAPCGNAVHGKVDEMSPAPSPLTPLPFP